MTKEKAQKIVEVVREWVEELPDDMTGFIRIDVSQGAEAKKHKIGLSKELSV